MKTSKSFGSGFTLIELVVVILIISILAITVVPKMIGSSGFDSFVYRDQMISSLRLIQQQSMQQTDSNSCHQIVIMNDGYGASSNCSTNTLIPNWQDKNTGFAIPIDSSVRLSGPSTLTFDSWGKVAECSTGCTIVLTSDDSALLCIESQGYIHGC
ncbi:type II secretion system protein [Thalassotalea psychrophila]|uniref:Type II secretion system protein n=1 Tax=Thalassotalea psychrophila TaxID=3065647 RepID=A0ABY9TYM3_9GAMM|nr:type II secretion system protein [Colwelliaceae bacterium SQ149]